MNKEIAKQILVQSIHNLQERRGNVSSTDLETEVINNACLVILRNQKELIAKSKSIEDVIIRTLNSTQDYIPISKAFTEAALELYPDYYTEEIAILNSIGIEQNIAWEGMWDFLRDYFQTNHGIQIDSLGTTQSIFNSSKHKRYENGIITSESETERIINLSFINEKEEILIGITPSLSPKKGYLVLKTETELQYKGYDPGYLFTINLDTFKEVDSFIIEMPNRNLKIIYFK